MIVLTNRETMSTVREGFAKSNAAISRHQERYILAGLLYLPIRTQIQVSRLVGVHGAVDSWAQTLNDFVVCDVVARPCEGLIPLQEQLRETHRSKLNMWRKWRSYIIIICLQ